MTEKKLYTCDICHTDYSSKSDAQQCEKAHCRCNKITDTRYNSYFEYPYRIEVEFSDGTKRWYKQ